MTGQGVLKLLQEDHDEILEKNNIFEDKFHRTQIFLQKCYPSIHILYSYWPFSFTQNEFLQVR